MNNGGKTPQFCDQCACFGNKSHLEAFSIHLISGIARCFTYGGSKNHILYDPEIPPRQGLTKEKYMMKDGKQTSVNHFHEKLFKLKDLMKTKVLKFETRSLIIEICSTIQKLFHQST